MISLERLFGKEAAHRLRNLGLHKLAAARLRDEGYDIPQELDARIAVQILGTKIREKNATFQRIITGITALGQLEQ